MTHGDYMCNDPRYAAQVNYNTPYCLNCGEDMENWTGEGWKCPECGSEESDF